MKVNTMKKCITLIALCACTILKPAAKAPLINPPQRTEDSAMKAIAVFDRMQAVIGDMEDGVELTEALLNQVAIACLRAIGVVNPTPEQVNQTVQKLKECARSLKRQDTLAGTDSCCVIL